MGIKCVIFDLDGTLSDSAILTMSAFDKIAPLKGLPVPSLEDVRRTTGYATPEFYFRLLPQFNKELVLEAGSLVEEEELNVLPSVAENLLFPGCRQMLSHLKKKSIDLHIASTGERKHVFSILEETGITDLFDTVFCGNPDKTESVREIITRYEKDECVLVGDMKKDFDAAHANGIISIGACYGYCKPELSEFDFYIDAPLDLLDVLKKIEAEPFSKLC